MKKILSLISFIAIFASLIPQASAFGVTPAKIFLGHVLNNTDVDTFLAFTRDDTSFDERLNVTARGEAASFLKFTSGNKIEMLKGVESTRYNFVVNAGSAATGTYTAIIRMEEAEPPPKQSAAYAASTMTGQGAAAASKSASEIEIIVDVTNEKLESWDANTGLITDTEVNIPVSFSFLMRNLGNVGTKPTKVHISISEKKNANKPIYDEDVDLSSITLIPPLKNQRIQLATKKGLKIGNYLAAITVYNRKGDVVYSVEKLAFRVLPEGSLAQKGEMAKLSINNDAIEFDLGSPITIEGKFQNTGTVGVKVTYVVEVYKDGKRIDIIKKEVGFVPVSKEAISEVEFTPKETGNYTFKGYFTYGISRTDIIEKSITIQGLAESSVMYILVGVVILIIILTIILIILRRNKKEPPIVPGMYCPIVTKGPSGPTPPKA